MSNLGPNDAKEQYEVPDDLTIPDFLRRAVAEATRVIAEMDSYLGEDGIERLEDVYKRS